MCRTKVSNERDNKKKINYTRKDQESKEGEKEYAFVVNHQSDENSGLGADYMGELSRLSELTRFAELTRFVYLFPIILTLRLHGKRVVPLSRDPACGLPRNSLRRDEKCHVITFCRVGPAGQEI